MKLHLRLTRVRYGHAVLASSLGPPISEHMWLDSDAQWAGSRAEGWHTSLCGFIRVNSRYADSHACASFDFSSKLTVPNRPSRAMGPSGCDTECGRDIEGRCGACCDAGLREDIALTFCVQHRLKDDRPDHRRNRSTQAGGGER